MTELVPTLPKLASCGCMCLTVCSRVYDEAPHLNLCLCACICAPHFTSLQICTPQKTHDDSNSVFSLNRSLSVCFDKQKQMRYKRNVSLLTSIKSKITRTHACMMKHLADICVNPQLLGGRQFLQEFQETLPICHCISQSQRYTGLLVNLEGEMAPSNLMALGVRKWPVVINSL